MRPRSQLLACLVALIAMSMGDALHGAQTSNRAAGSSRLASQFARAASLIMSSPQPTVATIEASTILSIEAARLDPANTELWRIVLMMAEMIEDDELQLQALQQIAELDPTDQVVKLKLLTRQIEQHQTVEERIAAYRDMLAPGRRDQLGRPVASRLALDLALLERRRGDNVAFAEWLAEAVALDQTNQAAAAMAAGYFRMHVRDAFAETELLVSLFLADPLDVTGQLMLAGHLLEHGAYKGAIRLYGLAASTGEAARSLAPDGVVADFAIAQWGSGDSEGALRTIRERQRLADVMLRRRLQQQRPEMTTLERARESGVVDPTLAAVRAALHQRLGTDMAAATMDMLRSAYARRFELLREAEAPSRETIARTELEYAWMLLWLDGTGDDLDHVAQLIESASQYQELTDQAEARFAGWMALRRGEHEVALEQFEPYVQDDPASKLGYATAMIETGRRRDGGRVLLELARENPGRLVGVWAGDLLFELLGQRVAVSTEETRRMEELIAAVPDVVDRFASEPGTALSLRITPVQSSYEPYEPVMVNVELTNTAPFPLAIGRNGPIRPQVALVTRTEVARIQEAGQVPPMILEIDRRLRLMPRERLVIPVDLRRTLAGRVMDAYPLPGMILRSRATTNFVVTQQGVVQPGVLGAERETPPMRVNGVRITAQWLDHAVAELMRPEIDVDVSLLATLMHVAATTISDGAGPDERQLFSDMRAAVAEAFSRLDSASQAWILTVMPRSAALEPVLAMARRSENRLVRFAYIIYHVSRADDPMLAAARRSGDANLSRFVELTGSKLAEVADDPFLMPFNER